MPVVDHGVHQHGIRNADYRYSCHNRAPFKEVVTAEGWRGTVSWPFRMARDCRYDKSLSDSGCAGCMHAGSGEAYVEAQERAIKDSK